MSFRCDVGCVRDFFDKFVVRQPAAALIYLDDFENFRLIVSLISQILYMTQYIDRSSFYNVLFDLKFECAENNHGFT